MFHRRQTRIFLQSSAVQVPFSLIRTNLAKSSKKNIKRMLNALNAIKRGITPINVRKSSRRNPKECSKCQLWKIKVRSNRRIKWLDKLGCVTLISRIVILTHFKDIGYHVLILDLFAIPLEMVILQESLLILVLISTLSPGIFTICWFVKD